jgi:hypothetical protein
MSSIVIRELEPGPALDRHALARVRGGANASLTSFGPQVNVSVGVNQNIVQNQAVVVDAFNNNAIIGAGVGPFKLDVSPTQFGSTGFTL